MNKKELLALPCTAPDWMIEKAKTQSGNTMMIRRKFGEIRTYEFYLTKRLKEKIKKPFFIVFRNRNEWINYEPQEKKWTTAMLENARLFATYDKGRYHWAAWNYIDQYNLLRNLKEWQRAISERRYNKKKAMIKKRTRAYMAAVPELPENFEKVVNEELMGDAGFLIYDRKKNFVHCTQCGAEYDLDECEIQNNRKMKHMQKDEMMCVRCGVWLQQISIGQSKRGKGFCRGIEIVQNYEDGVVKREFSISRYFEDKKRGLDMKTVSVELHRKIYKKGSERVFEINGAEWEDRTGKNLQIYGPVTGMYYEDNLKKVLKKSELTRGVETLVMSVIKKSGYRRGIGHIFENLSEKPCIEQIKKAGLGEIAKDLIERRSQGYEVKKNATTPTEALGITKAELKYLRKEKDKIEALEALQYFKEYGVTVGSDFEELKEFYKKEKYNRYQLRQILEEGINPLKLCRYVTKQEIQLRDYKDHLEILDRLNIRKNKKTLWPGNFRAEHQREIEEDEMNNSNVSEKIEKQIDERYQRWKELAKGTVMTDGEFQIMFPLSGKDIKAEGRVLHHCVGGYVDRVAAGETMTFYVRKVDTPDIRLYTAEYLRGKLEQIRASCNGKAAVGAEKLAEEFTKQLHEAEVKEEQNARTKRKVAS